MFSTGLPAVGSPAASLGIPVAAAAMAGASAPRPYDEHNTKIILSVFVALFGLLVLLFFYKYIRGPRGNSWGVYACASLFVFAVFLAGLIVVCCQDDLKALMNKSTEKG